MSNFKGQVPELENVLIDNFLLHESKSSFFLSHCHADHMVGLDRLFSSIHLRYNHYLYCSPISRLILLNKYNLKDKTVIKEITSTQVITVPENDGLPEYEMTVTPIPAGHCPGSIMFLFETVNKAILYTGDFRIMTDDVKKFKQFHSSTQVKSIDKVYLDTTFLNEDYWLFPSRSEVIHELTTLIQNWTSQSVNHNVILETSATYGYEFVFANLARNLECKIHVNDSLYKLFWNIPEIGCALTKTCSETKVHASGIMRKKCSPCKSENILTIRLSAQWYKSFKGEEKKPILKKLSQQRMAVCFSTHCSCSELISFLDYLKPRKIVPCCIAFGSSEEETKDYIRQLLYLWSVSSSQISDPIKIDFPLQRNYKVKLKFPKFEEEEEFFVEKKKRMDNTGAADVEKTFKIE